MDKIKKIVNILFVSFFIYNFISCSKYTNPEILLKVNIINIIYDKDNNQITYDMYLENTGNVDIDEYTIYWEIYNNGSCIGTRGIIVKSCIFPKEVTSMKMYYPITDPTNVVITITYIQAKNNILHMEYLWKK